METELKFKLPAGAHERVRRLLDSLQKEVVPGGESHEVTTYFDTPELALLNAGFTLRVRRSGNSYTQTLKGATGSGVAVARFEKEWKLRSARPDIHRLAGTQAAAAIAADDRLEPVFTTDIRRATYRVVLEGAEAELALDEGEIRSGSDSQPVHELEIELKTGRPASLYRFATSLHAEIGLEITVDSKAARGYRLRTGRRAEAREEEDIHLPPHATMEDGLSAVIGNGLDQLLGNLPALGQPHDPEPVHQMRVAVRRLRTALALFEPFLESESTQRFEDGLRRFGRVLGAGRDWDVFVTQTLPCAQEEGLDAAWLGLLAVPAEEARREAYQGAQRLVESADFTGFILALAGWTEGALWQPPGSELGKLPNTKLGDLAPELLGRLEKKVQKRGRTLETASAESLHALRKMLKKLRYACGYLAGLYPEDEVKKYRKHCKEVLDVLGAFNDAVTADLMVGTVADWGDTRLAPAVGILARWAAQRREEAVARLPKAWKRFCAQPPFWQ